MAKSKVCLREYVPKNGIFELSANTKYEVLKELASKIDENGLASDKNSVEKIYSKLIEREKLGSTGIIKHIAIPHCKTDDIVNDMVILVGYSKQGVDFKSHDGKPVHIVFAVFTRKDKVTLHLAALAAISRLISKHSISSQIEEFLSKDRLKEIIESCEYEI